MATFNEVLEGGLNQALAKRLGMQTGAPCPSCAPEIMPVAVVMGDRPDHRYWQGDLLWGGVAIETGAAGTFGVAQLRNPAGSGIIAVVTLVGAATAGSDGWALLMTGIVNNLANVQSAQPRDGRAFGRDSSCVLSSTNLAGAAVSPGLAAPLVLSREPWEYREPIILTPGTALQIGNIGPQNQLQVWIAWSERPVVSGEL